MRVIHCYGLWIVILRIVFIFPDGVKHTIFMEKPIDCITSMTRIPIPNIVENFRYFSDVWIASGESPWKDSNLFFLEGGGGGLAEAGRPKKTFILRLAPILLFYKVYLIAITFLNYFTYS